MSDERGPKCCACGEFYEGCKCPVFNQPKEFLIQTETELYNEISFGIGGVQIGTLHYGPPMRFEGDAEESAKLFFEHVVRRHDVELARLTVENEELRRFKATAIGVLS